MYLVLSEQKRASDYRQGYSIPSYTMSSSMMTMTMVMVMMTSIGKARQNNHFCREQRHAQSSCVKRGKDRVVGSLSLLGGLWNIVSLEVKEMVWGKRRLVESCLCSVFLQMEGEERRGKERRGKERKASKCQDMYTRCTTYSRYYYFLLLPTRRHCTYYIVNQSAHLSIYPSIHPSIYLPVYCTCTKDAYLLACLLTCWLLLLLRGRPNYIISYHVMLHSRIYYYYYCY